MIHFIANDIYLSHFIIAANIYSRPGLHRKFPTTILLLINIY